jgi:hypothetical protein
VKIFLWVLSLLASFVVLVFVNYIFIDIVVSTGFPIIGLGIFIIPFAIFMWGKIVKPLENKLHLVIVFVTCLVVFGILVFTQIYGHNILEE